MTQPDSSAPCPVEVRGQWHNDSTGGVGLWCPACEEWLPNDFLIGEANGDDVTTVERIADAVQRHQETPRASAQGDRITITEFAAMCRERCNETAQGHDELPCGGEFQTEDGEPATGFCGRHWIPVIGGMSDAE